MMKTIVVVVATCVMMVMAGCGSNLDAPTGLAINASTMTLSWNAVSGATSYSMYRGTVSGSLSNKTILAQNITTTSYTDSTATSGTTYFYQVVAVNSDGGSPASNEVSATPQSTGSGFALVGTVQGSQFALTWNAVANATNYDVLRGTSASDVAILTNVTTTSYTDPAPRSGLNYYQVNAKNNSGTVIQISSPVTGQF